MGFIESYKHLEKLCGEVLNDDRRISAYIDEMINTPRGSYLVRGWDDDLKQLKHYRWVRNQIAHEPDCTEQNMCEPCDTVWLDDFYSRIMNQTDPLALYSKAAKPRQAQKPVQAHKPESHTYTSLTLNFQRRPIFAAGIFLFSIQASTVSRLTPRYSQISFIEYQRSMLESIRFSSLSDSYNYTSLVYHTERLKTMIIADL